jgi:hypothetical protein
MPKLTATTAMRAAAATKPPESPRAWIPAPELRKAAAAAPPAPAAAPEERPGKGPERTPPMPKALRRLLNARRYNRVRCILGSQFPAAFTVPRALKIGVYHDIRHALGDRVSAADLNRFFWRWTKTSDYIRSRGRGDRRIDLAGQDAGPAFDQPPPAAAAEVEREQAA